MISIAANSVVNTIAVGDYPTDMAITPNGALGYVVNSNDGTVSVIDLAGNTVVGNAISVGANPEDITINQAGTTAYVTNKESSTVSVVNIASNTVVATINLPTDSSPEDIAVNPSGTLAYVTDLAVNKMSIINVVTNTVVDNFTVNSGPRAVAFNPSGTQLYFLSSGLQEVVVLPVPSTALQPLPSSDLFQLSIEDAANSVVMGFNGINYVSYPMYENLLPGLYTLYGFVEDSPTGNTILVSNSLVIEGTTPIVTLSASASGLDVGQPVTYTGLVAGGSGGPYTVNLIAFNGIVTLEDTIVQDAGTFSNTLILPVGSYSFNVVAVDMGQAPAVTFSSGSLSLTVANVLSLPSAPSLTSNRLDIGQPLTLSTVESNGITLYTYNFHCIQCPDKQHTRGWHRPVAAVQHIQ